MNLAESRDKPTILLIFSVISSFYYFEVGFALKPYMVLCILFFILSLKSFNIHYPRFYERALLGFFMYYCLTGFFAKYPKYSMRLILGVILILFCYFVMRYILSLASIEAIEDAISIGGIVFNSLSLILYLMGLSALGFNFQGNRINIYGVMLDRDFPRLIGLMADPNIFVFYNLIFFFYFVTNKDRKWSKIGLIMSSTTIMLTMSRGGILAVGFGLLVMFLFSNLRKKIRLMIAIPLSTILLNFLLKTFAKVDVFGMLINRFLADDGGSGRDSIWENGLLFFKESPFFGIGIFNYRPYSEQVFGYMPYMHNTYLEALVEGGVIGLSLYLLIFVSVAITYYNNRSAINDKGYLLFTFLGMALMMATYSFMVSESFFLLLAILWRYLHEINHPNKFKEKKPNKKKSRKKFRLTW